MSESRQLTDADFRARAAAIKARAESIMNEIGSRIVSLRVEELDAQTVALATVAGLLHDHADAYDRGQMEAFAESPELSSGGFAVACMIHALEAVADELRRRQLDQAAATALDARARGWRELALAHALAAVQVEGSA